MSDLIKREDAIDAVYDTEPVFDMNYVAYQKTKDIIDVLKDLPSAQQWIPCSERLPEEGEVVLTQAKFKDDIKMAVSARVDFNYWTGWGTREINIGAWMPLPEPFKGGDDND